MNSRKIISLFIVITIFVSLIPSYALASSVPYLIKDDPGNRSVYLYASEEYNPAPPDKSPRITEIGKETEFFVYFAIDDPNKGGYVPSGTTLEEKHPNPQYDLNGYNLKINFDTRYFELLKESPSVNKGIIYTIPFDAEASSELKPGEIPPSSTGYTIWAYGTDGDKGYAYISAFFNGEFLPEKTEGRDWYNICALPLKTKSRSGTGQIQIDFYSKIKNNYGTDEKSFQLFAKHNNDPDFSPDFTYDAVHGGSHWVTVGDSSTPEAPIATPGTGTYIEKQDVVLTVNESNCNIYWSKDPDAALDEYVLYIPKDNDGDGIDDGGITVNSDTVIKCYSERKDGTRSQVATYDYVIIPRAPYLHMDKNILDITYYSKTGPFYVTASNNDTFTVDGDIFYTFDENISVSEIVNGNISDNPNTGWKKVIPAAPTLPEQITGKKVVRLVTSKGGKLSYEKWYYLGIVPEIVTSTEPSGMKDTPIETELQCATAGADIYYTLDGSDPKTSDTRILYKHKLSFNANTVINTVAELDGVFGEIRSYYYFFDLENDAGIEAFHPSGQYTGSVSVHLTPHEPDNADNIKYKIDNGPWTDYRGTTFEIEQDTVITAKIVGDDGSEGEEIVFTYTIIPLPPIFAPESTQFTNADKITLFTPEGDAKKAISELWYSTDGVTDPRDTTSPNVKRAVDADGGNAVFEDIHIDGYTVILAVMKKYYVGDSSKYKFSDVVTHTYDIVRQKPTKPMTTLVPGNYVHKIGDEEGYSTQFAPVQNGIKRYYTVSYNGSPVPDLDPSKLQPYKEGDEIPVYGNTVITAISVNSAGICSDVAIFEFTVTPEAPKAPDVTVVSEKLPVIPVTAVKGSDVYYKIGDTTFKVPETDGDFYIDVATGAAYETYSPEGPNTPIEGTGGKTFTSPAVVELSSVLNEISSIVVPYPYSVSTDPNYLSRPYADKATGMYEEIVVDGCPEKSLLHVRLFSLNSGDVIRYKLNNEANWRTYTGEVLRLKGDTVVQVQAVKGNLKSEIGVYNYNFVPATPVITPLSGSYNVNNLPQVAMTPHPKAPDYMVYSIIFCANGDPAAPYTGPFTVDHTMSISAYVRNEYTERKSKLAIGYYVIEPEITASGAVEMGDPYYGKRRIEAYKLSESPYNSGIVLIPSTNVADAKINYKYTYTPVGGNPVTTGSMVYDPLAPIIVNSHMENIIIEAWLVDKNGLEIPDTRRTFDKIDFVDIKAPSTSLENPEGNTLFDAGTPYEILTYSEYVGDPKITKYYTTDGSEPVVDGVISPNAQQFIDGVTPSLILAAGTTNVKTVHRSACGTCLYCRSENYELCQYPVLSRVASYIYNTRTTGGSGGGGGGTVTRRYTKDIFKNEHPTHIGYIYGYPDGSVRPEGYITREEMSAILYRVMNHEYEKPFVATGEVFPDVALSRWSAHDVEYMAEKEVVRGYPDGEFKPRRNLTRAEFAALIFRFTEIEKAQNKNQFIDIDVDHWAYEDVLSLVKSGLMEGYPDKTFRPENSITRAEVMTVMNKILGRKPLESYVKSLKFNPYNDLFIDKWYYVTVLEATITHNYWLNNNGFEYKWEDWK